MTFVLKSLVAVVESLADVSSVALNSFYPTEVSLQENPI